DFYCQVWVTSGDHSDVF
nr:immunoglobulin light chain junction region [Macaca mulatta]MOY06979.1 immunoglobulin light chain junction region [Macaca mulatta]